MRSDPPAALPRHVEPLPPSAASAAALPSKIGGRYAVLEQLGRGGMAVVYRVRDGANGPERALKQLILDGDAVRDRETKALFEREFYILAQLSHPSVIEVYDYGVSDVGPYYTMELLDGSDLSARAPLPYREACEVTIQVCSSLSLLHARRLIHRDITPRNVRCTLAGQAKLIDFGAMVPLGSSGPSVGTPAFIAPEVVHRLSLDARADLFSLGATLYFALTGRPPFLVRAFADLRDAWSREPAAPGQFVAGIPPALDTLVLSLLSIDPERRPRSTFEVMHRLAAIAGTSLVESAAISQSYLATPTLVGRDAEQQSIRSRIRRALSGQGGVLAIESSAGGGRSRLLDACILDAKTLGATVLRISGRSGNDRAFESAQVLAGQLLEVLPEVAARCATAADETALFEPVAGGGRRLRPLTEIQLEREALQAALTGWFERVCAEQAILIAADDVERVDHATLALLAGLSLTTRDGKLLIAIALQAPYAPGASPALDVLCAQCVWLTLPAFSPFETESFVAALFGDVPQVALVADRIYKIAAGNPGQSLDLAQQLLDRKLIRYDDGQWILPAELSLADLPANAEAALQERVAALPSLARRLAEAQALSLTFQATWSRADYAEIVAPMERAGLDTALDLLVHQGVLVSDGRVYTLTHHTLRNHLLQQLSAADRVQHHLALAGLALRKFGAIELIVIYHWLEAGLTDHALDQLIVITRQFGDRIAFEEARMEVKDIAAVLERAFDLMLATDRPRRDALELARHLLSLSILTDDGLYYRYAPLVLAQLEQDSGLADYRAFPTSMPASERLQTALTQALARFEETPEHERVHRLDEAIKFLARFATISIVIGVRGRDSGLLASLPGMLEPFTGLSPIVHALWQNLVSATEMNYLARPVEAHARALAVYQSLATSSGEDAQYVDAIRSAVSFALGVIELSLGYTSASRWIELLDQDRMQQVNAMRLRSYQRLYEGDSEQAARYRTRSEVLAVQASARQMFDAPGMLELDASFYANDLSGVKRVADRIARRAANAPRWRSVAHTAHALYQRLRGDSAAALEAFDQSLALDNPAREDELPWLDVWRVAAAGRIAVLVELGRAVEARHFGERALEQAEELGLGPWSHEIARELALAEAKTGDLVRASERLDRLIRERAAIEPSRLAVDYEARACVAIWAKDAVAAAGFADLAVRHDRLGRHATRLLRQSRLIDEAREAGLDVEMLPTNFETTVLGEVSSRARRTARSRANSLLEGQTPAERAHGALRLLCEAAERSAGQLYIAKQRVLERVALVDSAVDPALDDFANDYWTRRLEDALDASTTRSSDDTTDLSRDSWTDPSGVEYQILLVQGSQGGTLRYIGLAALAVKNSHLLPALYWEISAAVGLRLLELGHTQGIAID